MDDTYNTGQVGHLTNFTTVGLIGFICAILLMVLSVLMIVHTLARPNDRYRTMFKFYWYGLTGRSYGDPHSQRKRS